MAYVFLLPPPGGRPWLAIHARGMAVLPSAASATSTPAAANTSMDAASPATSDGSALVVIPWARIDRIAHHPLPADELVLGSDDGRELRLSLAAFGGREPVLATVARQTQPLTLDRASAALNRGESVSFGSVRVRPDGLERTDTGELLPWDQVRSYGLNPAPAGERLRVLRREQPFTFFDGQPVNPTVCAALIGGLAPPAPDATGILAVELNRAAALVDRERRQARLVTAGVAGGLVLITAATMALGLSSDQDVTPVAARSATPTAAPATPPSTPPSLPTTYEDFDTVCTRQRGWSGAAPYTGAGPHPTVLTGDLRAVSVPDGWRASSIGEVRLVACGYVSEGPRAKTCEYSGGTEAAMHWGVYQITLREARTGRKVVSVEIRGANTRCKTLVVVLPDSTPPVQTSTLTTEQVREALSEYIE